MKSLSIALFAFLVAACPPPSRPPVPRDPAVFDADCRSVFKEELGHDPSPSQVLGCETMMNNAALRGEHPAQEVYRRWIQTTEEWQLRQARRQIVVLPRLVVRGQFFALDDGRAFTGIEATDFKLYQLHLDGVDIDPILAQRAALGYNMVRIFGMGPVTFSNGDSIRLIVSEYGERYWTEMVPFFHRLARHGLYGEWVAFIGNREIVGVEAQLAHWRRLITTLTPISNVIVEAMNENDQHPLDALHQLPRPAPPLLASHGSNGLAGANGALPVMPYWDWTGLHQNGVFEWPRKVGHNNWELWGGPSLGNENTRAPDQFQSPAQAFDAAAGAALLSAGSCFHSVSGRISALWSGLELELARAWANGAKSVPLACQSGPYIHRMDLERPEDQVRGGRIYERRTGDPACIVTIRP